MVLDICFREAQGEKAEGGAQTIVGAEVDKMIRCVMEEREVEGNYDLLHGAQGGVRMLIGASFTVLSTPHEWHVMAKYILHKEVQAHGNQRKALRCLRSKGWSQKESYECLDNVESPNCLKKIKHQVEPSFGPYILKARVPVVRIPQIIFNFLHKDWLRTQ